MINKSRGIADDCDEAIKKCSIKGKNVIYPKQKFLSLCKHIVV